MEEFNNQVNAKLPKGSCLVLDEAAIMGNSRTWYSLQNRLLNYVLITFRSSCLITFICMPSLKMLDSQALKLLHYIVEPKSINHTTNVNSLKMLRCEHNPIFAKTYQKYAWATNDEGSSEQITRIACPLPSLELRRLYEQKKAKFREDLGRSIALEIQAAKIKTDHNRPTDYSIVVQTIIKNLSEYESVYHTRRFIDIQLIRAKFGVGKSNAEKIKKMVDQELQKKL